MAHTHRLGAERADSVERLNVDGIEIERSNATAPAVALDGVAGEDCPAGGPVEADRPGRVTGRVDHIQLDATTQVDGVAVFQDAVDPDRVADHLTQGCLALRDQIVAPKKPQQGAGVGRGETR